MGIKKILVPALLIIMTIFNIHSVSASIVFKDVNNTHPQYEEIYYLVEAGIINGYKQSDGYYFKPKNSITRGEVATLVVKAMGHNPKEVTKSSFSDVPMSNMTAFIEAAVQLGIMEPTSTGKFSPNVAIKRDEMSKALVKAFKIDTSLSKTLAVPFKDVKKDSPYYEYVAALYYSGITNGIGNDTYGLADEVYRDSFSTFVARILEDKFTLEKPVLGVVSPLDVNATGRVYVTTDNLNVRATPSASGAVLGKVHTGSKLNAYSVEGNWVKVGYENQFAYVSLTFVKFIDVNGMSFDLSKAQKVVLQQDVTLYRGQSEETKEVGTLKKGQTINVYGEKNGWSISALNGIPGYFKVSNQVNPPAEEEPKPSLPTTVQTVGRVATDSLNIRQSASSTSAILGKVKSGNIVQVHSIDEWWAKVSFNGVTGYVHKAYLHLMNTKGTAVQNRIIVLDPGHGGSDPGAVNGKVFEKNIVLDVTKRVKALLENAGAKVILTRSTDVFIDLDNRPKIANRNFGELFISIHTNSYTDITVNGTETFYNTVSSLKQKEEIEIATLINNEILKNANMKNRGVKNANYAVTRNIDMPAILIELGFIKNPSDFAKLTSEEYLQIFAQSIYNGIEQFYRYK